MAFILMIEFNFHIMNNFSSFYREIISLILIVSYINIRFIMYFIFFLQDFVFFLYKLIQYI